MLVTSIFFFFPHCFLPFNSLPIDNISDLTKLTALADDKFNVVKMINFLLGRIENIEEKGENAVYQHFLLFPQCFQKATSAGLLAFRIVYERAMTQIPIFFLDTIILSSANAFNLDESFSPELIHVTVW